jgi:uncharacterized protein
MKACSSFVIRKPGAVVLITAATALFFASFAATVRMDNSMGVWLPQDSTGAEHYRSFVQTFGSEEFILIACSLPEGLTPGHILFAERLTKLLEKSNGIQKVMSLAGLIENPADRFEILKKIARRSSFSRGTLLSRDKKTSGILVIPSAEGLKNRRLLVEQIRAAVAAQAPQGMDIFIAGPPVINAELDRMAQESAAVFYPLLLAICTAVLFFFFRSIAGLCVPLLMMGLSLVATVGWIGILSSSLNIITIAALPLMMVISITYSMFFYNTYASCADGMSKQNAIIESQKTNIRPVLLSAVTTAAGFGSLLVSAIPPVRNMGLFVLLGVITAFILSITFLPALMALLPVPRDKGRNGSTGKFFSGFLHTAGRRITKHAWIIVCASACIFCLAAGGILNLKIETSILTFFPKENPLHGAYTFIESRLTGLSPIEIVIEASDDRAHIDVTSPQVLEKIKELQAFADARPEVLGSQSIADIMADRSNADLLDLFFISKKPLLQALDEAGKVFITKDKTKARVSVKAKTLPSEKFLKLTGAVDSYLAEHFNGNLRAYATGIVPVIVHMQDSLYTSLLQSFYLAFGIICIVLTILIRSVKGIIVAIIPNLLPIIVTMGLMGWIRIKLDVATIMIASIAIGMLVDNTIYFIFRYRHELAHEPDLKNAIHASLEGIGKPIICTSLVTASGFLILGLSAFKPMALFGLMTGITIIAGMLGDLVLHPALLAAFKIRYKLQKQPS